MLKISIVSNRVLRWFCHSKPKKRYILKIFLYHVYITSSYITHIVGTAPNTTIRHTFRNLNLSIFQYNYVSQVYLGPLRYEVLLGSRKYQVVREGEDVQSQQAGKSLKICVSPKIAPSTIQTYIRYIVVTNCQTQDQVNFRFLASP